MTEPGSPLLVTSPDDRERLRRLFRIKRTELEMMRDRGFDISQVFILTNFSIASERRGQPVEAKTQFSPAVDCRPLTDIRFDFNQFLEFRQIHSLFNSRILFTSLYTSTLDGSRTLVMYLESEPGKQVVKDGLQLLLQLIYEKQLRGMAILLIAENGIHPGSVSIILEQTAGYDISIFFDKFFAVNPTKHAFAPINAKLIRKIPGEISPDGKVGPDSIEKWAAEEGIKPSNLPLIFSDSDPLAKYYGAKNGDIFELEVLSKANDVSGYYRLCFKTPAKKKK